MVLKLYGHPHATCTQRVGFVLNEKEVPFELVVVDLKKGEQKLPAHLKHQPFGQIPYIVRHTFNLLSACSSLGLR